MLPAGSSPLLAKGPHHDTGWIVPPADTPSYTGSSWPTKKSEKQRVEEQPGEEPKPPVEAKINTPEYTPPKFEGDLTVPDLTGKGKPVEQDRIEIEIGDGNYQGGGTFENPEQKTWYNNQISQRTNKGMSHEEAIQDYRNTFKIGKQDKDIAVIEGVKGKFRRTK
jgi:hypothetical protein